jgi:mono/diheme cytochrome c family protein
MKTFFIGLIIGLALWPIGVACYIFFGNPPVAVADGSLPLEHQIRKVVLHRRIAAQQPKSVPIQPNEDNFMAGAQIYANNCAACHGTYNETTTFSQHMFPWPPPMWQAHGPKRAIGVSNDSIGGIYWKVSNGIRLTGMPAFKQVLTPTQIWQVSVLLKNADKPLPPPVQNLLSQSPARSGANAPLNLTQPPTSSPLPQPTQPVSPSGVIQPQGNQPSGNQQTHPNQPSGGQQPPAPNSPGHLG